VVKPAAKKWPCGADIPVCFFLVKQEGQSSETEETETMNVNEAIVEDAALKWFGVLG